MKVLNIKKSYQTQQRGFTLIDVMVAMGVLGIVLASLFASFTFGFNMIKFTREELQATQLLQEKLESIRLYNWDQALAANSTFTSPLGNSDSIFFTGTITNSAPVFTEGTYSSAYTSALRQITVTITWTNNNTKYSRSTSTYISSYGLFNYTLN